jgi:hypothetical protein
MRYVFSFSPFLLHAPPISTVQVMKLLIMLANCLPAGFCWIYFVDPENEGDMFLWNVGGNWKDCTVSYPRRW